jgi:MFS transporter, DHA1 family, multidrug resistance protein
MAQTAAQPASPAAVVTALALLLSLQPVATDLYLPALPALSRDLGSSIAATQLTLSALLLSFGFAQLLLGPVSDRLGRRPVLLAGLSLFAAASAGAALSQQIGVLIVWRALQGVGMAAAVVCARAVVRDLHEPREGAQVMSMALTGLGIVALSSPPLGGLLASAFGWRATLLAVALFGAAALAFVALKLPESVAVRDPSPLRLAPMVRTWAVVLRDPGFRAWALLLASSYAGLFAFLAGSSFVYIEALGTSKTAYGFWVAACSSSYLVGTVMCRRWVRAWGLTGAVRIGGFFTLAGGMAMLALALAGVLHPLAVTLPQCLYVFGHGVHQPCGQAAVTGPFPRHAGAASALAGFVLALGAVLIGLWLGKVMDGHVVSPVLDMAGTIAVMSVATALVAWTLVQRHGEAAASPAAPHEPAHP